MADCGDCGSGCPICWYFDRNCFSNDIDKKINKEYQKFNFSDYGLEDIATFSVDQILENLQQDITTYIEVADAKTLGIEEILTEERKQEIKAHAEDRKEKTDVFLSVKCETVNLNYSTNAQDKNVDHIIDIQPTTACPKTNASTAPKSSSSAKLNLKLLGERWANLKKTFLETIATLTPDKRQTEETALRSEIVEIQEKIQINAMVLTKKIYKRKTIRSSVIRFMAMLGFIVIVTVIAVIVK